MDAHCYGLRGRCLPSFLAAHQAGARQLSPWRGLEHSEKACWLEYSKEASKEASSKERSEEACRAFQSADPAKTILGTAKYVAPEILLGSTYDGFKVDIWAW